MGRQRYFATTSRGLEEVLAGEIASLGGEEIAMAQGGVSFAGSASLLYRANLWLRTANRVLLFLARFPAPDAEALYEGAREVPWPDLFSPDRTIAVEASVRDSGIGSHRFAAQKTKDAVADAFRARAGRRPDVDLVRPGVRIHARIVRDECILSLDTSGESLNRRGYRAEPSEASLRETVAAGLLFLAGWEGQCPLLDPMCGSGTIPVEAALLATNTAPGLLREEFGFRRLHGFDGRLWERLRREAREAVRGTGIPGIEGSDADAASIRAARRNGGRAGIGPFLSLAVRDVRALAPPGPPGVILCNPPYGVRLEGGAETAPLYRALGEALKRRCAGWTAWILSGNPDLTRHLGLAASRRIPLRNGPIDCRFLRYDLY